MNILVDENIPRSTVKALESMGHDVRDIRGTAEQGTPDPDLWQLAQSEQRILITTDKGFTQYRDEAHNGILIVRLRQPNRHKIHERVMQALTNFTSEEWPGLLVIMRDTVQSISRSHT